jgi:putative tryptophan/tyrosine transport system substrate-binding protein
LGWAEGRNLQLEIRWSGGEPSRIQAFASDRRPCEVIVARSTPAVAALIKETHTIPIVFSYVVDPIGSGFVQSFARPGGNVTGFQTYEFTIAGKWFQLLTDVAPSVRRIGLIHNPATAPPGFLRALEALPPSNSVQLVRTPVHSAAEIDAAIAALAREPGGGLMIMPDTFNDSNHAQIVALASTDHYFVLRGTLTIETRGPDNRCVLPVGERYKILPGIAHRISNESASECQFLLVQGVGKYDWHRAD